MSEGKVLVTGCGFYREPSVRRVGQTGEAVRAFVRDIFKGDWGLLEDLSPDISKRDGSDSGDSRTRWPQKGAQGMQ